MAGAIELTKTEQEKKLSLSVTAIERQADTLVIRSDDDFAMAGSIVKEVKATQKKVEEYWEPMRSSTYAAYKAVTDHKNEMTVPLKNAEKTLKKKMADYQTEQARKKAEEEARIRRMAQEEMERKLEEAAKAEKEGDIFGAEFAMCEAQVMETMAASATVTKPQAKVNGISQSKAWRIKSIDLAKLPCEFSGITIRPADEKAIMRLIRASKGNVQIPGVEYEETVNISVRAS